VSIDRPSVAASRAWIRLTSCASDSSLSLLIASVSGRHSSGSGAIRGVWPGTRETVAGSVLLVVVLKMLIAISYLVAGAACAWTLPSNLPTTTSANDR
jgi:hypothetical protein